MLLSALVEVGLGDEETSLKPCMMKSPRPLGVIVKLVIVELASSFTGLFLVKVFVATVP